MHLTNRKSNFFALMLTMAVCLAAVFGLQPAAAASSFVDDDGREVTVSAPFERIISMYSAHTENLYDLGAGDTLIGAHSTSTFPAAAAFLPRYDYNADPEKVIAADPDLVIIRPFISKRNPEFVEALETAGIQVVSLYPEKFELFDDYFRKLALLTGNEETAEQILTNFHQEIQHISDVTAAIPEKQRVFFESTDTNLRTVTDDSMAGLAIQLAGGINVAAGAEPTTAGSSIASFGAERILENADEIDVYISQRGAMNAGGNQHTIRIRPGFQTIKAVQDGRIYVINEKMVSSPNLRFLTGVREIARYLYPEVMDDLSSWQTDTSATRRDLANIIFHADHLPIYTPSSSKYYEEDHSGHVYGMFEDIPWTDADFDAIETIVVRGLIELDETGEVERFNPDEPVTRYDTARAIFISHTFPEPDSAAADSDLSAADHPAFIQAMADFGIMDLNDGAFEPDRVMTCGEIVDAFLKAQPYLSKEAE